MNKKAKTKKQPSVPQIFLPKVRIPSDLEFMRKLNKRWEDEYRRWLVQRKRIEKILGKGTLIIGARAKDGVILTSDRKIIRGGESEFEDKIRVFNVMEGVPIVFCAAGYVGVTDDFLEAFQQSLTYNIQQGTITSLVHIKFLAEDLLKEFEERYAPRLGVPPIEFIFGGLDKLNEGEARLYAIGPPGYGERIHFFRAIGHGSDHARTILKYLLEREKLSQLSVEEATSRALACIYWIRGEIDDYVGGDPQIVAFRDDSPEILNVKVEADKIEDFVQDMKNSLKSFQFPP